MASTIRLLFHPGGERDRPFFFCFFFRFFFRFFFTPPQLETRTSLPERCPIRVSPQKAPAMPFPAPCLSCASLSGPRSLSSLPAESRNRLIEITSTFRAINRVSRNFVRVNSTSRGITPIVILAIAVKVRQDSSYRCKPFLARQGFSARRTRCRNNVHTQAQRYRSRSV